MEEWRNIVGYEGLYEVSSEGRVRSLNYKRTGKAMVLKPRKDGDGYLQVTLCKNGEHKFPYIHRLVAEAFIENPMGKPEVNHKDENKENNCVSNLEWMTRSENVNYGTRNERVSKIETNHPKKSKPVLQYTKEGEFVKEYPSTAEAERQTGIDHTRISACCLGKLKSAGNYIWKYKNLGPLEGKQ